MKKILASFEGLKITNDTDLNLLLADTICDDADPCENLYNYYETECISYNNVQITRDLEVDNVPVVFEIRDVFFECNKRPNEILLP